ncbi:potassium channel family protein [Miltoncostaea marina]|uniref:potassium channel family protein n=1 Tax=Miltoncostaea marina TaxID=2843215 RepID=UPI001C3D456D|nr:NAD-binding protein [Miltoncostaea marina]
MFAIVVGGGKIGANVTRSLADQGREVVVVEQRPERAAALAEEFGHRVIQGDGTELYVLERAGITRPPEIVAAVTGDDEDNIVIAQLARERYGVQKVIGRVNDPRNQEHFDLLGVSPTVCSTARILALVEHEVPQHDLVHLLELRNENLAIVEVEVGPSCPCVGAAIDRLGLPDGSRLISVVRDGTAQIATDGTVLQAGDQVLAILEPAREGEVRRILLGR